MQLARWLLVILLWLGAIRLEAGTRTLALEVKALLLLRWQLLQSPKAALQSHCMRPMPERSALPCDRRLYWHQAGGARTDACLLSAPLAMRRYELELSCTVPELSLKLPLLTLTVFR